MTIFELVFLAFVFRNTEKLIWTDLLEDYSDLDLEVVVTFAHIFQRRCRQLLVWC